MVRRKRGAGKGDGALPVLHLESYWPRLPAFRVVAEHENLQEASRILKLSASSTSRTIRLLESELGVTLFSRAGRRLMLTAAGTELLDSVRRAMRIVDDGAATIAGAEGRRPLRVALPRTLMSLIAIPTIERLKKTRPDDVVHLRTDVEGSGVVSGLVDLAVVCGSPVVSRDIEIHALGELRFGVYCGKAHRLWASPEATLAEVAREPFVSSSKDGVERIVWPAEHRRTIPLDVTDSSSLVEACRASLGLALLPVAVAKSSELREVRGPRLEMLRLFGLRRVPVGEDRVLPILHAIREVIEGLARVDS